MRGCFGRDFLKRDLKVLIGIWLLEKQGKSFSEGTVFPKEQGLEKVWNIQGSVASSVWGR